MKRFHILLIKKYNLLEMIVYAIYNCLSSLFLTKFFLILLYIVLGDTMYRGFRKKRKFEYNNLFNLIITIMILYTIIKFLINSNMTNKISSVLLKKHFNNYNIADIVSNKIINNFNNPVNLVSQELNNYKTDKNEETIEEKGFDYKKNNDVLIYIYNSHQGEKYAYKYLEDYNIVPDVKMVAHMIEDNLSKLGIKVIVEDADILAYMKEKEYNHAQSYIASRTYLEEAINKYPKALLYIDLHRDAALHKDTYIEIEGKACAKVLFVVGLENSNWKNNLNTTEQINNIINNKYKGLSRGIMKKQGPGVNGVYNQDLKENVILLEVGGNENNIDELINTTNLISNVLGDYINEKKEK